MYLSLKTAMARIQKYFFRTFVFTPLRPFCIKNVGGVYMGKNIFRTKSISEFISETKQDGGMNRVLGTFGLTMLGIGCIIGTGIFVLTGIAAANYSGPALIISFIIAALACGCAALCYSEFAAMVPVAGSAYTYGYVALGEFWAWIIGWDLILEYTLALSAVSIGWKRVV